MPFDPSQPGRTAQSAGGGSGSTRPASARAAASDPQQLLAHLWQQNLPLFRERVSFLQQTAAEHAAGHMTEAARTEASNIAHKLAGSLGMFGYGQGTEIARELEQLLDASESPSIADLIRLTTNLRQVLPL